MSSPKSQATKHMEEVLEEARLQDLRRQAQIANQVDIINRLLEGATFDEVQRAQVVHIGRLTVELNEAKAEISRLQAELERG